MTDDLLSRLRNREAGAQRELFEYCDSSLRGFMLAKLPNPDDADDCVNEVFARALEGLKRGLQPRVLEAWLVGIAKNVLKERYDAKNLDGGELPDDLPAPSVDSPLELGDGADLPDRVSDYEMRLGKRQLWDMLLTATAGLSAGIASVVREHMELTLRRGHLVVGTELAEALGQPVDIVNRQLNRGRKKMLSALVALALARPGGSSCSDLGTLLRQVLSSDQLSAGRDLKLNPAQATAILDHATGCAACAPHVEEARDLGRWALGPGLVGLAGDDDERRRALIALLDRAGEGRSATESVTATAAAIPVPLAAATPPTGGASAPGPAGIVERVRTALATRVAAMPRLNAALRFAGENPEIVRRAGAAVAGGIAAAAVIGLLAADRPVDHSAEHRAVPGGVPPVATSTAPPAAPPSPAGPTTSVPTPAPPSPSGAAPAVASQTQPAPAAAPTSTTAPPTIAAPETSTSPPPTTVTTTTTSATSAQQPPPPPADAVDIDVSDTDYTAVTVSGISGTFDPRQVQHRYLAPGPHTLTPAVGGTFTFLVTNDERIEYDPSLEGTFTGWGTSRLTVHGSRITLDVSDVDYGSSGMGGIPQTGERRHTYRLLPGPERIVINNAWSYWVAVTRDGHVTYDHALQGILTGDGSPTLAMHGFRITLDVSDVDYGEAGVSGTYTTKDRSHVYRLLPGPHYLVVNNFASYHFTITDDGHVTYDPSLRGPLTGEGGTTLGVHGFPVTVDVSDVDYVETGVSGIPLTRDRRHVYKMVPGPHYLIALDQASYHFRVTDDGHVTYDPSLEGHLTGDGGTTLGVHGFSVTVDARDSGEPWFSLDGIGTFDARQLHAARLLPMSHAVTFPSLRQYFFRVGDSGHVDYDHSLDAVLSGRDSSTLVIRRRRRRT